MTAKYTDTVMKLLDTATSDFTAYLPKLEDQIADAIENMMGDLEKDRRTGLIKPSAANFEKLALIKAKLETVLNDTDYGKVSAKYLSAYTTFTAISNNYFNLLANDFSPTQAMDAVKTAAIDTTIQNLGKTGLLNNTSAALKGPAIKLITNSISAGKPYLQTIKDMRLLVTGGNADGPLVRYAKPVAIDSLNRFAANYINIGSIGLGVAWFMYVGAIIKTSRCFCRGAVDIKYIHRSQFQQLIDMDFPQFDECSDNSKTGLPEGMIAGTNTGNLIENRGGYGCNHQFIPVPDNFVPENVRKAILALDEGYKLHSSDFYTGGAIQIHENAHQKDLPDNIEAAKQVIKKHGDLFQIAPHIEGQKNPEFIVNKTHKADLKSPDINKLKTPWRSISEGIQRAEKQDAIHALIKVPSSFSAEDMIEGVRHGFKNAESMKYVDLLLSNKDVVRITRSDYESGNYKTLINLGA